MRSAPTSVDSPIKCLVRFVLTNPGQAILTNPLRSSRILAYYERRLAQNDLGGKTVAPSERESLSEDQGELTLRANMLTAALLQSYAL